MRIRPVLAATAVALSVLGSTLGSPAVAGQALALNGLDPVELSLGRQVRGKPSYSLTYGPFRYQFVSWESLEQFEWNPALYEVQYGGATAVAGPNGPQGDPSQFAVHQGRIYTFANDADRQRFVKDPESFIERPDPAPTGDAASAAKGKALIQKAVEGFGGGEALARLRTYATQVQTAGSSDDPGDTTHTFTSFPATMRQEHVPDGEATRREVRIINGSHGFIDGPDGRMLETVELDGLRTDLFRDPLMLVKARHRSDFRAFAAGSGTVDGAAVEYVNAFAGGVAVKLGIDPQSGRILSATYRDRMGDGRFGQIIRVYSNFKNVDGLTVPLSFTQSENGTPNPAASGTVATVEVNPTVPENHFGH